MSDIETTLRSLAKAGRLNHTSVAFSNGKWVAVYRGVDHTDQRHAESDDPAAALAMVLTGRKVESTMRPAAAPRPARKATPKPPAPAAPAEDEDDLL